MFVNPSLPSKVSSLPSIISSQRYLKNEAKYSRFDQVKFVEDSLEVVKGCLPQILLDPFLNTLPQIIMLSHTLPQVIMLSHSKAQFLLKVKCAKSDSVFYCIVLNIERFDTALEHFQLKIRKNDIEILSL